MDLAHHIQSRGHTHFVPVVKSCEVKLTNLTFSAQHHRTVVKRWKRMVKDGDITELSYDKPRHCGKCKAVMLDAIDMIKHIRDSHIN